MDFKSFIVSILVFMTSVAFAAGPNLSRELAEERAKKISSVEYEWKIQLNTEDFFEGDLHLFFDLTDNSKTIPLDFFKGEILSLKVNGAKVTPDYDGKVIQLEKDLLVKGRNSVQVVYKRSYNKNGTGLTRVKDPKDGRVYVYTQFQTMDANQAFPCFDQPDIKAKYTLTVTAPQSWTVVTSVKEKKVRYNRKKQRVWTFPQSAKFSTYLLSLHGGPYKVWKSKAGNIPLRLMARRSLAKNVEYQWWFKITQQGFQFFQKEFASKYPYKKYDQLIVPEFNAGAMENVGAVTFNESYISRGKKSRAAKRGLADTILHEMAHMWFGNLVTMKWWNDLWLNESFATYLANKALYAATEYKEVWRSFYSRSKSWAYWEDQLVTTHPIEAKVPDVHQAMANFDGITYGKGAAVFKQLNFFIGERAFRKGVQSYFKKYAEQNTTRAQFMAELSKAYGSSLDDWQKSWLTTAGVNKIGVVPNCKDGHLVSLDIEQHKDQASKVFRSQKFLVALLNNQKGKVKLGHKLVVNVQGAKQVVKIPGQRKCPDLIYPNYQDQGYFQAKLDKATVNQLFSQISNIDDNFLREMFWKSLWTMVREGDLSVYTYGDILLKKGLDEKDNDILQNTLRNVLSRYSGSASVEYYLPNDTDQEKARKNEIMSQIENSFWLKLNQAKVGSDLQRTWYDYYISSIRSESGFQRIKDILNGKLKFKGFKVDQDRRWGLLRRLTASGVAGVAELVKKEQKLDNSRRGKLSLLSINAAKPNWDNKIKLLEKVESENSGWSLSEIRSVMGSLFPVEQESLRKKMAPQFYSKFSKLIEKKDSRFLRTYTWIQPLECKGPQSNMAKSFLQSHSQLHPSVLKKIKIRIQEDERCRKVMATAKKSSLGV